MTTDILVPPLSQTMDSLVLVEWVKQVGDPVTKGEVLFRVETDKATLDVEAPATGVLQAVYAQPGDEIKVKASIGTIAAAGEAGSVRPTDSLNNETQPEPDILWGDRGPLGEPLPPERLNRALASPRARELAGRNGIAIEALRGLGTGPRSLIVTRDVQAYLEHRPAQPRATPLARRMANAAGVDLAALNAARPGEPITKADITAEIQSRSQPPAPGWVSESPTFGQPVESSELMPHSTRLSPTRMTIARRMAESHTTTAPVTYLLEVDATRLVRLRERLLKNTPPAANRPTHTDFLVHLLCPILLRNPDLNATFDGETLTHHPAVHLALAVDTGRGLVAPVIHAAQSLGVSALAQARTRLVERARAGTLAPDDLTGGTFTLSNLGALGVDQFTPILNPPQVAILGVGRIRPAPAVHKGRLRIRQLVGLSLTCDHRIVDGAPAARFLHEVGLSIEEPDRIWL